MAVIGQQWRMRLPPGQRIAIQPQITLRPKYGMRMKLEARQDAATAEPAPAALTSGS